MGENGNRAYGKTVTNKEKHNSTTHGNEDKIFLKIYGSHFEDLDQL